MSAAAAAPLSPNPPASGEEAWDELSPDGLTLVRWGVSHGRMSHVMISPELCDAATGSPFLTLDSSFDGHIHWAADGRFTLHLRHYVRDGDASVEIDRPGARFRFLEQGVTPGPWHKLDRISREVEARFTPSNDELDRLSHAFWAKLNAGKPKPVAQPWGTLLFILFVLACLTIVGLFLYAATARIRI